MPSSRPEAAPEDAPPAGRNAPWRVWIDTGGTFTDCVVTDPAGRTRRAKVLSSSALRGEVVAVPAADQVRIAPRWPVPADFFAGCRFAMLREGALPEEVAVAGYDPGEGVVRLAAPCAGPLFAGARCELRSPDEAPVLAARLVTATSHGTPLPPLALRLATTRGTNALLERRGAAVALFVTRGFADLLEIGDQARPDLFALAIVRPPPLHREVVEVDERLAADGSVLRPLEVQGLAAAARRLRAGGIRAAAVALLHSDLAPAHERQVAALLRRGGLRHVVASAELAPLVGLVPRAGTAVVEAYLAPVLEAYLDGVEGALPRTASLHVMTSAGGLVRRRGFRAADALLSGPAGGVAGAAAAARRSGLGRVLTFDMGGTSTDVARWDGDFEYVFEHRVGDARLLAPALAIETVAAGGGSVCRFDGLRLTVGPESAGASPGPACYGAGGPLTVTDVNLLLGRLDPARFGIPLAPAAAERAFAALRAAMQEVGVPLPSDEELLAGLLAIADERMAAAIRSVSVARGFAPADHALVAFGGAGGQHACAVAERLGIREVLVPADAGLLSALGLGAAVVERFAQRQVLRPMAAVGEDLAVLVAELSGEAAAAVAAEGVAAEEVVVRRRIVHLRFAGQEAALAVEPEGFGPEAVRRAFAAAYRERYGYLPAAREVEVESVRVVASSRPPAPAAAAEPPPRTAEPSGERRAWFSGGGWCEVAVYERPALAPGDALGGPALVFETHGATVVAPGWQAQVDGVGGLRLSQARPEKGGPAPARPESGRPEKGRPRQGQRGPADAGRAAPDGYNGALRSARASLGNQGGTRC
ncbi:MAG TPA: hydantoinase/oxoprolinase family protein [Thermoanaerobaculia bacterium]|nr:hydantoinase/oxoprolinase family protein [Thermoanaerobaculia bacterium]